MDKEQWKPVVGQEGNYEVSNWGRVRSLDRQIKAKDGSIRFYKGKMLSTNNIDRFGYRSVGIGNKFTKVHRLVAEAFILNPEGKPQVNHIDGDPGNNDVNNLEWATRSENIRHSYEVLGHERGGYEAKRSNILCVETGKIYKSMREASRETGVPFRSISGVIRGRAHSAGGYHWKRVNN